ncbi:MAG: TRAP transporter small permease [SAR324 cluster bacterium]|nr:TRAP transporter small permease [SAR324 cluster bacterium]
MIKTAVTKGIPGDLLAIFDRFLTTITRFSLYLSGGALFLLLFSYTFEVIIRYFFDAPTTWSYDLGKWFLGASILLALPEITSTQSHIAIDFIIEKLPANSKERLRKSIALLAFSVCMSTAWICLMETSRQFSGNIETFWNNPVPKWWFTAIMPYSFTLSGIHFLRSVFLISNTEE